MTHRTQSPEDRARERLASQAASRPTPAQVLATPSGRPAVGVSAWFEKHPEAAEFAREWRRMTAEGTCDWTRKRLLSHLQAHFAFPHKTDDSLGRWINALKD